MDLKHNKNYSSKEYIQGKYDGMIYMLQHFLKGKKEGNTFAATVDNGFADIHSKFDEDLSHEQIEIELGKLRELKDMQDNNEPINYMYEQEYLYKRNNYRTKICFFTVILLVLIALTLINEFVNVPIMLLYRIGSIICLIGMIVCFLNYYMGKRM